ncbi:MAG TPA: hypothetical protein VLA41_11375 [Burkholderiales bacterium]|nr:hypothetical protein [Burkholderiales bacterium]
MLVALQHVRIALASGEFYPVEELEHLDREVAPDARAVAERRRGDRAAGVRLLFRELFETAQCRRQEEARFRNAHQQTLTLET